MMLGDQGADVIKVEPLGGELVRQPMFERGGLSSLFMNCNRNKRSVSVDISKPEGVEIVQRLVAEADVFIQNWRPGAADRNGLGEVDMRKLNPDLIYCSISGFGSSGAYAERRVYDPIIQGLTGYTAVQASPELPIRDLVRNIVADKSSAYTAAQAIAAALFARQRGAGGQLIEVPMIDASLAFFWPDGMMRQTFTGDDAPSPNNSRIDKAKALGHAKMALLDNRLTQQRLLHVTRYQQTECFVRGPVEKGSSRQV